MDKLPVLLSVPHAGLTVPSEVADICILSEHDIIEDGDEHAAEIYWPLEEHVEAFVTTDIARAVVDLNRAEDDFRKDGVIKTHTCWDEPVYEPAPPADVLEEMIRRYHAPYHARLTELVGSTAAAAIRGVAGGAGAAATSVGKALADSYLSGWKGLAALIGTVVLLVIALPRPRRAVFGGIARLTGFSREQPNKEPTT